MSLPHKRRDDLMRYGLAVALACIALFLRKLLPVPEGTTVYQLPLVAVVLAGWYGGRGPGLFASLICWIGVLYWLLPPVDSSRSERDAGRRSRERAVLTLPRRS